MNKQQVLDFWVIFFKDLLVGTFKKLFLFSICGFFISMLTTYFFDLKVLDAVEWNIWLEGVILSIVGLVYLGLGFFHGLISCSLHILNKKLREAVSGLQDLLDWLAQEVIGCFPKFKKT